MERLIVPVEWKAASDGTLEGYLSTFGNVDLGNDVVQPGAFDETIKELKAGGGIPLLADHVASTSHVLGTIYDAVPDSRGLKIKARFSSAPSAQDVRIKLVEGHVRKMSMGYEAKAYSFQDIEGKGTVRSLDAVHLWEGSVVVFPMNTDADITRAKSLVGALGDAERKALAEALADAEAEVANLTDDTTDSAAGSGEDAEARHAEAEGTDVKPPAGADDSETSWDRYASDALLAGEDPKETADPATVAGLRTALELNEAALGLGSDLTDKEN